MENAGATGATTAGNQSGSAAVSLATPNPGATGAAASGATGSDWMSGFNEENKGYVQTKGFKDPSQVVDSYRNLEKLMGVPKERLLKLPEKDDAPEWGDIYNRLGRPEKPEGYGLTVPEGAPKEFSEWAAKNFHELGFTRKQGETLVNRWNEFQTNAQKQMTDSQKAAMETDREAIRKEWGAATDKNASLVDAAATAFGLDSKMVEKVAGAIGVANTMRFLYRVGSKLGEDNFITGDSSGGKFGPITPGAAKQRIGELMQDKEFVGRYTKGDLQAKEEMMRLHQYATPEVS